MILLKITWFPTYITTEPFWKFIFLGIINIPWSWPTSRRKSHQVGCPPNTARTSYAYRKLKDYYLIRHKIHYRIKIFLTQDIV